MGFSIIQTRKTWYGLSIATTVLSLASILLWGFNLSLHFTGGVEVKYTFDSKVPQVTEVRDFIVNTEKDFNTNKSADQKLDIGVPVVVAAGEKDINIRMRMDENATQATQEEFKAFKDSLSTKLLEKYQGKEMSSQTISPSVGQTLKEQSLWATLFAVIAIMLYVVFAFWKLPKNYSPWVFGFNVIAALAHDIVILCGVFSFLGEFFNVEVGPYFITALLTILGYSVNDTIVVFDRVRENFSKNLKESVEKITEDSIWQTMARSLNTSFTIMITLGALLIFGAESIRMFALALFVGVIVGTYSSIFIASPLLVTFKNYLLRK